MAHALFPNPAALLDGEQPSAAKYAARQILYIVDGGTNGMISSRLNDSTWIKKLIQAVYSAERTIIGTATAEQTASAKAFGIDPDDNFVKMLFRLMGTRVDLTKTTLNQRELYRWTHFSAMTGVMRPTTANHPTQFTEAYQVLTAYASAGINMKQFYRLELSNGYMFDFIECHNEFLDIYNSIDWTVLDANHLRPADF
jgi:hypothetical protein